MKNFKHAASVTETLKLKNMLAKSTTFLELGKTPAGVETNDQALLVVVTARYTACT